MPSVLVLHHSDGVGAGRLEPAARRAGLDLEHLRLHAGAALPAPGEHPAVVALGGFMGAYEEDQHPFLAAEKGFLRAAVAAGVPVLGLCLGCQLLAAALGGRAYRAPALEAGLLEVTLAPAAATDPVLTRAAGAWPVLHHDTWEPPPGAAVLAATADHPHAFRAGSALGLQFHPEADAAQVGGWLQRLGRDGVAAAGVDAAAMLADIAAAEPRLERRAGRLFDAWLARAGG